MEERDILEASMELMEACKLALAHCDWMEANGYEMPPLPTGETLKDRLKMAIEKAAETGRLAPPKTETIYLGRVRDELERGE